MEQWQYEIILGLHGEAQEEEDKEEQHLFCVVNEFKIGKGETSVERPESSVKSHYIPLSLPLSLFLSVSDFIATKTSSGSTTAMFHNATPEATKPAPVKTVKELSNSSVEFTAAKFNKYNLRRLRRLKSQVLLNAMSKANIRRTQFQALAQSWPEWRVLLAQFHQTIQDNTVPRARK